MEPGESDHIRLISAVVAPNLQRLSYTSYGKHDKMMFKTILEAAGPALEELNSTPSVMSAIFTTETASVYLEPFTESPPPNHPIPLVVKIRDHSEEPEGVLMTSSYKALLDALPKHIRKGVRTYEHKSAAEVTQRILEITSSRCPQIAAVHASWSSEAARVLTADKKGQALFKKLAKFMMAPDPKDMENDDPDWIVEFAGHRSEVDTMVWRMES